MRPSGGLSIVRNPALSQGMKSLWRQWVQPEVWLENKCADFSHPLRPLISCLWQAWWCEGSKSLARGICFSHRLPTRLPWGLAQRSWEEEAAWSSGTCTLGVIDQHPTHTHICAHTHTHTLKIKNNFHLSLSYWIWDTLPCVSCPIWVDWLNMCWMCLRRMRRFKYVLFIVFLYSVLFFLFLLFLCLLFLPL